MASFVEYLGLIAVLCGVWMLFDLGFRCLAGDAPRWLQRLGRCARQLRRSQRPEHAQQDTGIPLVVHELELARLAAMVQTMHDTVQPARAFRVSAASAAYDMELLQACRTLGVDTPPGRPPLTPRDRFETEARLLSAGLHW